jgi:hypothetical protein
MITTETGGYVPAKYLYEMVYQVQIKQYRTESRISNETGRINKRELN